MMSQPSRALTRLDAAIAASRTPVERACQEAERAALLGRLGHVDEARAALAGIRSRNDAQPQAAVTAWVCLAEGLIDHYANYGDQARDRLRRAHALSVAARVRPLIALSAAWLAHMAYVYGDHPLLARHIGEALQEAAPDQHAARARAALVVAAAYHWGGRLDQAQPWYQRAREHATTDGDEATLSALICNRAWIAASQARLASTETDRPQHADPAGLRQLVLAVESSTAFDQRVGKVALRSFVPLQRAQLLILEGQPQQALALYDRYLDEALAGGMGYMEPLLRSDIAWCRVALNDPAAAREQAERAAASFGPDIEEEDRAAAHGRLAQVWRVLGDEAAAAPHAQAAAQDRERLQAAQARIVALVDEALARIHGLH